MSTKELFDSSLLLIELWQSLMPNIEPPPRAQFLKWAAIHGDNAVTYAIGRVSRKSAKVAMTTEDASRYCSAVLRDERTKRESQSTGGPQHANF